MTSIFIFGTLCHAPLFAVVAGCDLDGRAARLPGQRVVWVKGASYPMLTEGSGADGLLVEVDDSALARLDFYEACFDYHLQPVTVTTDSGPVSAMVWRPAQAAGAPGADWSLNDWAAQWGALSTVAATEVIRQIGQTPPQVIGQRFGMIRSRAQSYLNAQSWHRPGLVGHGFTRDDVDIEAIRHPYSGFFCVEESRARFRRFGGGWSAPVERAMWRVSDAVTVLPYDPVRDRILLIEQARFGVLAHGDRHPWLLEPIAGMIDAGETSEAAARRETLEEAGLTLGDLHFISRYYPSPGGIAQGLFSYVGIADLPDDAQSIGGALAEDEDILSHIVDFDMALRLYEGGDMADAPSVISFQWLLLNRDRLRAAA
jgi:nudix-type nucleoside diphosphatase (YffH/AdpP family)